jgi:hypothetical protein
MFLHTERAPFISTAFPLCLFHSWVFTSPPLRTPLTDFLFAIMKVSNPWNPQRLWLRPICSSSEEFQHIVSCLVSTNQRFVFHRVRMYGCTKAAWSCRSPASGISVPSSAGLHPAVFSLGRIRAAPPSKLSTAATTQIRGIFGLY